MVAVNALDIEHASLAAPMSPPRRARVLVLARSYPNAGLPLLGLWTQRLAHCVSEYAEVKVVSPVPYVPPVPQRARSAYLSKFRAPEARRWDGEVEVFHPRMGIGPGYVTRPLEAVSYRMAVGPTVQRLRRRFAFDLIHAHFSYPDGVAACLLGRRLGVPVVITEHVPWLPWMVQSPVVLRQAAWAARSCDALVPVSRHVRSTIVEALDGAVEPTDPIPLTVDDRIFRPSPRAIRNPDQLLFVGAIRHVKGVDVLLEALVRLRRRRPAIRLVMAGEPFYRSYRVESERMAALARERGVADLIDVVGGKSPHEIAALMRESAAVVVPGRDESFSSVAIEAIACGTPVVATRCGGPQDIVTAEVGRLVAREDPDALAAAIGDVLDRPDAYPPERLRREAVARFGPATVGKMLASRYTAVLTAADRTGGEP